MIIETLHKTYVIKIQRHRHPNMVIHKKTDTEYLIKAHKTISKAKMKHFFLSHLEALDKLPGAFYYDEYLTGDIFLFGRPYTHSIHDIKNVKNDLKTRLSKKIYALETKYKTAQSLIDLEGLTYEIKYYKSRFGSCHPTQRIIRFNMILAHYDLKYLEYIYVHEIAHLNEPNHQQGFYQLMDDLLPNHRQLAKALKQTHATFLKEHI